MSALGFCACGCGASLEGRRANAVYFDDACRVRAHRARRRLVRPAEWATADVTVREAPKGAEGGSLSERYRVVPVEDGAPCLAVQHKDAPAVLGMGKTSFEKYVVPQVRCIRRGSMRIYMVRDLEGWLERNAEGIL
jgi:hypothetical protein